MNTNDKRAQFRNPVKKNHRVHQLTIRFARSKNKEEKLQIARQIQESLEELAQPTFSDEEGIHVTSLRKLVSAELTAAMRDYSEAALKDDQLSLLLLVDPLRAFADVGIELSKDAQNEIRRTRRGMRFYSKTLYDDIRSGKGSVDGIQTVRLIKV